jgi:hypothetical protein
MKTGVKEAIGRKLKDDFVSPDAETHDALPFFAFAGRQGAGGGEAD